MGDLFCSHIHNSLLIRRPSFDELLLCFNECFPSGSLKQPIADWQGSRTVASFVPFSLIN